MYTINATNYIPGTKLGSRRTRQEGKKRSAAAIIFPKYVKIAAVQQQ